MKPSDVVLQELGITDPSEIDVEAIAWHLGAEVRYRPLDGCEARIIGNGSNAIITINESSSARRKRFSVAHELGHWHFHKGKLLVCHANDIGKDGHPGNNPERVADRYAADLLMPHSMLQPIIVKSPKLEWRMIDELANAFDVSRTAMAIRIVEGGYFPSVLVCHSQTGRRWFTKSSNVPGYWFPQEQLDSESFAFDILFGSNPDDARPRKIGADAWFNCQSASRHEIFEQTVKAMGTETLTLLSLNDRML